MSKQSNSQKNREAPKVYGPPAPSTQIHPMFNQYISPTETHKRQADPQTLEGAMYVVSTRLKLTESERKIVREYLSWGGNKVSNERLERAIYMAANKKFDVNEDFTAEYRRAHPKQYNQKIKDLQVQQRTSLHLLT